MLQLQAQTLLMLVCRNVQRAHKRLSIASGNLARRDECPFEILEPLNQAGEFLKRALITASEGVGNIEPDPVTEREEMAAHLQLMLDFLMTTDLEVGKLEHWSNVTRGALTDLISRLKNPRKEYSADA